MLTYSFELRLVFTIKYYTSASADCLYIFMYCKNLLCIDFRMLKDAHFLIKRFPAIIPTFPCWEMLHGKKKGRKKQ